jgi:hypothetical protein
VAQTCDDRNGNAKINPTLDLSKPFEIMFDRHQDNRQVMFKPKMKCSNVCFVGYWFLQNYV